MIFDVRPSFVRRTTTGSVVVAGVGVMLEFGECRTATLVLARMQYPYILSRTSRGKQSSTPRVGSIMAAVVLVQSGRRAAAH